MISFIRYADQKNADLFQYLLKKISAKETSPIYDITDGFNVNYFMCQSEEHSRGDSRYRSRNIVTTFLE